MSHLTDTTRQKVFDEKGEECIICGTGDIERFATNYIHIHHVNGDQFDNRIENLIPVCNKCHINIHRNGRGKYKKWQEKLPEDSRYTKEDVRELIQKRSEDRGTDNDTILVAAGHKARQVIPYDLEYRDTLEFKNISELEENLEDWSQNKSYTLYYTPSQRRNTDIVYSIGCSSN